MDPLSMTVSALTLIGAGGKVTKGLSDLAESLKTVDSRLTGLDNELSDLRGYLQAAEDALNDCKQFGLSLGHDGLWEQSEIALSNCQTTLNELINLVDKIKNASWPRKMGWKLRVVIDMKIHEEKLAAFHDKFHQSNSALQTMLHIIVVSISLRQNTSQNQILSELHGLKASINRTWNASSKPLRGYSRHRKEKPSKSSHHVTHNLRHLAAAAESFYASASSTASTTQIEDGHSKFLLSPPEKYESILHHRYDTVEDFPDDLTTNGAAGSETVHHHPGIGRKRQATALTATDSNTICTSLSEEEMDEDSFSEDPEDLDGNDHIEHVFLDGLRELAVTTIKIGDFEKAIELIQRFIFSEPGSKDGERGYSDLYSQLILCYFCQGKWKQADPLVDLLAGIKATNLTVEEELLRYNFSHALALGYLSEFSFDQAIKCCKQALLGKRRLCKTSGVHWVEYHETLALFATINEVAGDCVRAEIFRRPLPPDFVYNHPESELVFIQSHTGIVATILGSHDVQLVPKNNGTACHQIPSPVTAQETALHMKLSQRDKDELDTLKEILIDLPKSPTEAWPCEADEISTDNSSISSSNLSQPSPIRQQLTRLFRSKHTRHYVHGECEHMNSVSPSGVDSFCKGSTFRRFFHNAPILKARRLKRPHPAEFQDIQQQNCSLDVLGKTAAEVEPAFELEDTSPLVKPSDSWIIPIKPMTLQSYQVPPPRQYELSTEQSGRDFEMLNAQGVKVSSLTRAVYSSQQQGARSGTQLTSYIPVSQSRPSLPHFLDNIECITSQLTEIFASLNKNHDLESLQEQERLLSELFPRFQALSNDRAMVSDTRVVLFSLQNRILERQRAQEDSGYESAASSDSGSTSTGNDEFQLPQSGKRYSLKKPKRPWIEIQEERKRPPLILNTRVSLPSHGGEGCATSHCTFPIANLEEGHFFMEENESAIKRYTCQKRTNKEIEEEVKGIETAPPINRKSITGCLIRENPEKVAPSSPGSVAKPCLIEANAQCQPQVRLTTELSLQTSA